MSIVNCTLSIIHLFSATMTLLLSICVVHKVIILELVAAQFMSLLSEVVGQISKVSFDF